MILYSHEFAKKSVKNHQQIKAENILDGSDIGWFPTPCIGTVFQGNIEQYDPASIEDVFSDERVGENLDIYMTLDIFALIRLVFNKSSEQLNRSNFAGAEKGSRVAWFLSEYLIYPQYVMFDQKWLKEKIIGIIRENEEEMVEHATTALGCTAEDARHVLMHRMGEGKPPSGFKDAKSIIDSLIADKVADLYERLLYLRLDLIAVQIFHSAIYSQLAVDNTGENKHIMTATADYVVFNRDRNLLVTPKLFQSIFMYGVDKAIHNAENISGTLDNPVSPFPQLLKAHGVWFTNGDNSEYPQRVVVEGRRHIPELRHREMEDVRPESYEDNPEEVFDKIAEIV